MLAWAMALGLVAAPTAPEPTVWAKAGARGWTQCRRLGREAAAERRGQQSRGESGRDWRQAARRCPHCPSVLVAAAEQAIVMRAELSPGAGVKEVEKRLRKSWSDALSWLDAAAAESMRRGRPPPRETHYLRAYVLLAMGRVDGARAALARSQAAGEVVRWRADRMGAVIALLGGSLQPALWLSHRAVVDAPATDRPISRYVRALILDRVGSSGAALQELSNLRRAGVGVFARDTVSTLLPVHERLYLRALDHQASGEIANALRAWEAYLARPEPAGPEREQARRHSASLVPKPAPVVDRRSPPPPARP